MGESETGQEPCRGCGACGRLGTEEPCADAPRGWVLMGLLAAAFVPPLALMGAGLGIAVALGYHDPGRAGGALIGLIAGLAGAAGLHNLWSEHPTPERSDRHA